MINLIVIGCTGLVGKSFVDLCEKIGNFENVKYYFGASENSIGREFYFNSEAYIIKSLEDIFQIISIDNKKSIFVNCSTNSIAREIYKFIKSQANENIILIDNSSEFRLDEDVRLIIPEINFEFSETNIYSTPNCCTVMLAFLLNVFIKQKLQINSVNISTYQSASGAGLVGYNELLQQSIDFNHNTKLTTKFWNKQYIFNCFPHNSPIVNEEGYNEEEIKLILETQKIFKQNLNINPTCIRIPTLQSHCLNVVIEFEEQILKNEIIDLINNDDTLIFTHYPDALISNNSNFVFVGHIRKNLNNPKVYNFFISGDQILRGSAVNAFNILQRLISRV